MFSKESDVKIRTKQEKFKFLNKKISKIDMGKFSRLCGAMYVGLISNQ